MHEWRKYFSYILKIFASSLCGCFVSRITRCVCEGIKCGCYSKYSVISSISGKNNGSGSSQIPAHLLNIINTIDQIIKMGVEFLDRGIAGRPMTTGKRQANLGCEAIVQPAWVRKVTVEICTTFSTLCALQRSSQDNFVGISPKITHTVFTDGFHVACTILPSEMYNIL